MMESLAGMYDGIAVGMYDGVSCRPEWSQLQACIKGTVSERLVFPEERSVCH